MRLIEVKVRRATVFPFYIGTVRCNICGYEVELQHDYIVKAYGEMWRHFKQKHSNVLTHIIMKYVGSPRDRKITEYTCGYTCG